MKITKETIRKFRQLVHKGAGRKACWLWVGTVAKGTGYGRLRSEGKQFGAHRLSYTIARGSIAPGLFVCHRCDNPLCVRPAHLFLGTQADNMAGRAAKGRAAKKLTPELILQMRGLAKQGMTGPALAAKFGVVHSTVYSIIRGKNWRHLLT